MESPACPQCSEMTEPVSPIQLGVIIVLVVLLIYLLTVYRKKYMREKFVSQEAKQIFHGAKEVFDKTKGDAPYSMYKQTVPQADPVQYNDMRKLYMNGRMTPESVQQTM